jgi:hypothetical protein
MGPLSRPAEEISDDPNGYEGLSRRGSYERLLISEWLLADEAPEEFLRRAAQREHAFLALSFHRPGGSRRSLALFDAGPELIGEPRVGQLAALVVLSQRARRDGATFGWGVLQDEARRVWDEVTPASVLQLLFSRTTRTARAEDAADWAQTAGAPLEADDLWVVGSPRTVQAGGAAASRVELEDPLELGRRDLVATVRRKGAAPRPVELPLPAAADCVRLLRDPFSVRRAPVTPQKPQLSPANGIAFAQNGRRLLVRHRDGSVSAHPVPNSPRMSPGLPKTFELRPEETLIAAGWMRGARVVLVQDEAGYSLHGLQRRAEPVTYSLDGKARPSPGTAPAPLPALLYVREESLLERGSNFVQVFLDAEGHLFALGGGPDRAIHRVASDVVACAEREGRLHLIRGVKGETGYLLLYNVDGKDVGMTSGMPGLHAFFGGDSQWVAVEKEPDHWDVFTEAPRARRYSMNAAGSEVFGVTASPQGHEPALLVVEPDRRSVGLLSRADYTPLLKVGSPIVQAIASGRGSEIALLGADGMVTVTAVGHRSKVLELKPPPRPLVRIDLASLRDEEEG